MCGCSSLTDSSSFRKQSVCSTEKRTIINEADGDKKHGFYLNNDFNLISYQKMDLLTKACLRMRLEMIAKSSSKIDGAAVKMRRYNQRIKLRRHMQRYDWMFSKETVP
ncbi:hypothetical protein VCUG_02219 [Vavraia culicis subsp. floridensis]|uniref:Uncharacterized protein n=1 Tax=Vavraia culicis (isolate floridensis) TaxID=948595 RepID=L2GRK9_VAVCU|nr:uncharacterized protein VCUG_02219 [Vavraia culicis subsp. floridensis]ELA46291.1 hypothetical protein VCUG_02219 [Vavraia culicis subsp. floridensis]